jgi:serine protease inhibitor
MNGRNISAAAIRGSLAAGLLCTLSLKSHAEPGPTPQALVSGNCGFAFNLFQRLVAIQPGNNVFISPYSASTALQMVATGAEGATLAEMRQVLGTSEIPSADLYEYNKQIRDLIVARDTNFVLTTANSIWFQNGFPIKADFLQGNEDFFGATVDAVDFNKRASAKMINTWASQETQGKINQIVSYPMDPGVRLLLANAVYFHGNWANQFDTNLTTDRAFYAPGGAPQSVPMMEQTGYFSYSATDSYKAVRLPYQGSNIAMYIFLPATNSSLEALLGEMSGPWWQQTVESDFSDQNLTVVVPKFNLNYSIDLNGPLEALGMTTAFTPAADFSGISPVPLFISKAHQQAIVEVNEEGTVAAAVTTITVVTAVVGPQPTTMLVNRPFLFFIEDRQAGTILFIGAVFNPQ